MAARAHLLDEGATLVREFLTTHGQATLAGRLKVMRIVY
jgi:hypothetical protein